MSISGSTLGKFRGVRTTISLALLAVGFSAASTRAQTNTAQKTEPTVSPTAQTEELDVEDLQARIQQIEQSKDLEEETKTKILDLYGQALEQLRLAQEWASKAADFEEFKRTAPRRLEEVKAKISQTSAKPSVEVPPKASSQQLEQKLSEAEEELKAAQEAVSQLEKEAKLRSDLRSKIPKLSSDAKQRLEEIERQLDAAPLPESNPMEQKAQRTLLLAHKMAARQQIHTYEKELASYEATTDELMIAQRDLTKLRSSSAEELVKRWREIVDQRRRLEAERTKEQARQATKTVHPAVREKAEENAEFAEELTQLARMREEVGSELERIQQSLGELRENHQGVIKKTKTIHSTRVIGSLLRQHRADLPNVSVHQRGIDRRQSRIEETQENLFRVQDQRAPLAVANFEKTLQEEIQGLRSRFDPTEEELIENEVREILEEKREYLDTLSAGYEGYLDQMIHHLNVEESLLIQEANAFSIFIDERILWIRSTKVLPNAQLLPDGLEAGRWLIDSSGWKSTVRLVFDEPLERWLIALGAVLLLAWVVSRRRILARIKALGKEVSQNYTETFGCSLGALGLTFLLALGWPAAIWFFGWRLSAPTDTPEFASAVGMALQATALVYLMMGILRNVTRPNGLAEMHFRWRKVVLGVIRRNLAWFAPIGLPLFFVVAIMENQQLGERSNSLGRLACILGLFTLGVFMHRVMRPRGIVMQEIVGGQHESWIARCRLLWYGLAVGTPLFLAGLAFLGYYYTALELAWRLQLTLIVVLVLVLLNAMLVRWLFATRGKLAKEQARQQREASRKMAEQPVVPPSESPIASEKPRMDLSVINIQTRQLLRSFTGVALVLGLWWTWADVLPALGVLRKVELWSQVQLVAEETLLPDLSTQIRNVERIVPTTLADLGLAVVIAVLTVIASKNIPGLLEITLLKRLPLEAGVHYAVMLLFRYAITIFGVILACATLGIGWSNIQWMLAAITVGLGFGLQEIIANFVSGLILLCERPIRVGDIVTVGEVTGVVTRIQIRATTIRNWDRKEYIVPNKEFITGRLLNWTLSDTVNRIVITVGVAYGSDTAKARQLLFEAAQNHPLILDDPAPLASFEGFGDSTLNFVLRCYLPDFDKRLVVIHELHSAIDQAFREANIEIAFPQQDLHIRSIEPPLTTRQQNAVSETPKDVP